MRRIPYTRAQHILYGIEEGAITASLMIGQRTMTQGLRNKYDLHKHIDHHRQVMGAIRNGLPRSERKPVYQLLRHHTINNIATDIHNKREKDGKNPTEAHSMRMAKRAFTGNPTGTSMMFRNTPGTGWSS